MSTSALRAGPTGLDTARPGRPDLDRPHRPLAVWAFGAVVGVGLLYVAYSIYADVDATGAQPATLLPYGLLFVALIIALGFEFVNGFHDTANAVATVIYTHSLPAQVAVVWSGFFNFLGVLVSTGAVAFGIVSLLPVELTRVDDRERGYHLEEGAHASDAVLAESRSIGDEEDDRDRRQPKAEDDPAQPAPVGAGRGDAEARAKALGTNPNLVTLVQAERWNGVLPTTMVPGSSVPFVSVK